MPLSSRPINRDDPTASAKKIAASLRCSRANGIPLDSYRKRRGTMPARQQTRSWTQLGALPRPWV